MNDDAQLVKAEQNLPQTPQPAQSNLNQYGNDSTQIAYVQNYDATVNQTVVILPNGSTAGAPLTENGLSFDYDCFNLFVLGAEEYTDPYFIVSTDRALTEYIAPDIKSRFASFTPEAIAEIKKYPALFCSENHHYAKTDPDHMANYGYIKDIKVQDNGIKVYYQILNQIPQQTLNAFSDDLCLKLPHSFFELSRTHWTIKRINLVEVLEKAGYRVFKL